MVLLVSLLEKSDQIDGVWFFRNALVSGVGTQCDKIVLDTSSKCIQPAA